MAAKTKLYGFDLSHPVQAVRLALELKGIGFTPVNLLPGMHPLQLRAAGFKGGTVPALKIGGRKIQGSLKIMEALEEMAPEPPLYPADPAAKAAAIEAERWGESVLQPLPRRVFRDAAIRDQSVRRQIGESAGVPMPDLMGRVNVPVARYLAKKVGANEAVVRDDLAALPEKLDHVDALIKEGVIGGETLGAADFQIGVTVRVFLSFPDVAPLIEGRPCEALARRVLPFYGEGVDVRVPSSWLP